MNLSVVILLTIILVALLYVGYRNRENFEDISPDVIDDTTKYEVESIVDIILQDINKKFNKDLLRGAIDRVEKTVIDDATKYSINIFVYNNQKKTNRKTEFNVSVKDDTVYIDSIRNGISRKVLNEERAGISGRGSLLHKFPYNIDLIEPNDIKTMEYTDFNILETSEKMVDRNSWILPKEAEFLDKKKPFPCRIVYNIWDKNGVELIKEDKECECGLSHATKYFDRVPNYYISNYTNCDSQSDNHWLFDPAQDSASRPIGITGATGSA